MTLAFSFDGYTGENNDANASYRQPVKTTNGPLDQIRIRMVGGATAATLHNCDNVSIGLSTGTKGDTTATPTPVTFGGGNSGFSLNSAGSTAALLKDRVLWSDWVNFNGWSAGDSLVVVMDLSASMTSMMRSSITLPAVTAGTYIYLATDSFNVAAPGVAEDFLVVNEIQGFDMIEVRKTPVALLPKTMLSSKRSLIYRNRPWLRTY